MTRRDEYKGELRGVPVESQRGRPAWIWLLGIVTVAVVVGILAFGTPDRNTTATNVGPPATGSASITNNSPAATTGSGASVPTPSPSPNR
jgi:hypothetical protein